LFHAYRYHERKLTRELFWFPFWIGMIMICVYFASAIASFLIWPESELSVPMGFGWIAIFILMDCNSRLSEKKDKFADSATWWSILFGRMDNLLCDALIIPRKMTLAKYQKDFRDIHDRYRALKNSRTRPFPSAAFYDEFVTHRRARRCKLAKEDSKWNRLW
jgi:hypothetical protein